jgi:hypothetical protein
MTDKHFYNKQCWPKCRQHERQWRWLNKVETHLSRDINKLLKLVQVVSLLTNSKYQTPHSTVEYKLSFQLCTFYLSVYLIQELYNNYFYDC